MDVRVKNELKKGLESANQLRVLFNDSRMQNRDFLMASLNHHSSIVLDTFETAITMLKNAQLSEFGLDGVCNFSSPSSTIFNHPICDDNTRTSQSQPVKVIKSSTIADDGYCWRKYGRKPIANSKHPREYYRCGHQGQGCQARKQVQIVSENPTKYGIIYYGHHTCQTISMINNTYGSQFDHLFVDSNDNECPNMLCFGSSNVPTITKQQGHNNVMKQEHRVANEDMPKLLLPHDKNTPLSSSSSLSSDCIQSISLDQWVQDRVNEDVSLPKLCCSMDSPLFTDEDLEYFMSHVVDFDRE